MLPLNFPKGSSKKANLSFKNKFPYIFVIDEARDSKFGSQLEFTKAHHQIPLEKSGCGPGLGELPEIWGFPFDISATDEASDFKFGTPLDLPRPIIKSHPEEKVMMALG